MHSPHGGNDPYFPNPAGQQATSGAAVASLIFGIIGIFASWCLFGIPSILAIVLGHVAAGKTRRGLRPGHGMAVAGLILGYIVVIPAIILIALVVVGAGPESLAEWVNDGFGWIDSLLNS
ncbi:hypothetical protein HNP84_000436 [Thermocatellispora tengchongensis]|uniref:DUF4190 domain-containing protein n=1 Tax=Thermocatellispora tengchongensis TaxID=1073253 RepID=A0A840NT45_9ACTN|nr:DUF4190 domain-containing protein [Thermocatellispora tengchongensis]MBB5130748.1 hypothetical protein [Thermocatellispora tengchongensis]